MAQRASRRMWSAFTVGIVTLSAAWLAAQRAAPAVPIDPDDIGGVVAGPKGPEAQHWHLSGSETASNARARSLGVHCGACSSFQPNTLGRLSCWRPRVMSIGSVSFGGSTRTNGTREVAVALIPIDLRRAGHGGGPR